LGDNVGDLVTEDIMKQKREKVAAPLRTPGYLKKSRDATSWALFEDTPKPPKVETIKLQVVEDKMWLGAEVPSTLISHIGNVKDTLLQTVDTIPGLYRDFSTIHELLANDIDTLQTRVNLVLESQKVSRQESTVMGDATSGNISLQALISLLSAELERISKIANDAAQVMVKTSLLQAQVNKLEGRLNLTLQALIELKQNPAVFKLQVEFETTKLDRLDDDCLFSLEQQVRLLSSKNQISCKISVFTDLISGIRTIKDVESWLLRYYYNIGEDPPDERDGAEETDWNFTTSSRNFPRYVLANPVCIKPTNY
jgi:hypothetical protein